MYLPLNFANPSELVVNVALVREFGILISTLYCHYLLYFVLFPNIEDHLLNLELRKSISSGNENMSMQCSL